MHFDIAIIGFGPVGAAAANIFANKGFSIIVIDPKTEIWDIPRAVHFDGQTQRIFQSMGIFDEVEKIISDLINKTGASGMKDMGKIMGMASKQLSGMADGKTISNIVRTKLS